MNDGICKNGTQIATQDAFRSLRAHHPKENYTFLPTRKSVVCRILHSLEELKKISNNQSKAPINTENFSEL